MAKVTAAPYIESISGKLCGRNRQYISTNRQTGKMHLAEYHGSEDPNTAKQQAVRTTFAQKAQAASAWWQANKPLDKLPDGSPSDREKGTPAYQALMKNYKSQRKFGSPYAYLRSLVQDDLTITVAGTTTTFTPTTGGTPTVPDDSSSGEKPSQTLE